MHNVRMGIDHGVNKARFPAPVPVGGRLDAQSAQVVTRVSVEIEGGSKPACAAETVSGMYFDA